METETTEADQTATVSSSDKDHGAGEKFTQDSPLADTMEEVGRARVKTEQPNASCSCAVGAGGSDSMDTNNNNNLPAAAAEENMATESQQQQGFDDSPSKNRRRESPAFSDISQIRLTPGMRRGAYSAKLASGMNKQQSVGDPLLSATSMAAGVCGQGGSDRQDFAGGPRTSSQGRGNLNFGVSPDFPNINGTPTSVSQLLTLPSSSLSLEGFEFSSPMGSGTFSPLTSARLGRKRQLSISPLSSSSLDLNNLIRTSPTSLVNYIANSRGSSAGSIGHLSPSLFANPGHFQSPHGRQLQFTLRNTNYPLAGSGPMSSASSVQQGSAPTTSSAKDSNIVLTSQQIKKESSPSNLPDFDNYVSAMDSAPYSFKRDNGGMKMESLLHQQGNLLEPVQEEPVGLLGSSDDEGMPGGFMNEFSSIPENEAEMDTKAWNKVDPKKTKRVYYSYPSVEEPHNNVCRWGNCNKQCQNFEELVQHVNSDHIYQDSRKEFVCCWSGCVREKKPFKAQYMLLVHMRRHTGEKPHKCSYEGCNKAYSRLENLKTHLRSHTGERPYICKYEGCGKAFSNASDCAKHMNRTHSDEKPYACPNPGCNKRYTDPSSRRKHLKNCQVNKKARTDDGMSGADEESSAETASTKSNTSNSSSKKTAKPKKSSEKRKSNNPPSLRVSNAGPTFTIQQQTAASSMLSGDNGYGSGESQGYLSSHAGYLSSSGYDTEHHSLPGEGPEEIARILQEQRLSDPHDMAGSQFIPHSQDHVTSPASHVTSNMKVGRQMGGGGGPPMMQHHHQLMASPNQIHSFPTTSQSGFPSFNPTPPHDDSSLHPSMMFADTSIASQLSPQQMVHGHSVSVPFPGSGLVPHPNGKTSRNSSSGYSSFRSSSPNKHLVGSVTRKSPSDDGSIVGSSLKSSIMTNSYSTFSSNSSRVSSPSSTSGRGGPHPPHSPLQSHFMPPSLLAMTPHSQHLQASTPGTAGGAAHFDMPPGDAMGIGYPLKHSLRMSNSYPQKPNYARRNSQDSYDSQSDSTSRSWQCSSQSSRYSYARSELSDEQIEKLPTFRRDSFSKNQPLPLPESMQQDFSPVNVAGMGMEFEQNGGIGMEFISSNTDPHSQQSQPSPMQLNVSEHQPTSVATSHNMHVSTLPLHHMDHHHHHAAGGGVRGSFAPSQVTNTQGTMFSQDSGINDESFDMFFGGHGNLRTMSMSPNMALGDMASFANSLPEETHYLEQLLSSRVK